MKDLQFPRPSGPTQKLVSTLLSLSILLGALPAPIVFSAPLDETSAATDFPTSNVKSTDTPRPSRGGPKEPMIEVSVDSLEISENNASVLGVLWGQGSELGDLAQNQVNFIERTIPSLFNVGQMDRAKIAGRLDALIRNNQVRVLANPTLLTKSEFDATFLVGGEIPYPQVGQGGVTGVDYKKYGVSVKILPKITPRDTIDAQVNVSVSNPDPSVGITIEEAFVPGLASRETSSRIEVRDGETVVLAGIKQSRRSKVVTRVPVLGYIPILGLLFRHKDEQTTQTSLVLFVTFRLVKS